MKEKIKPTRTCAIPHCDADITHKKANAITCSDSCRQDRYRHNKNMETVDISMLNVIQSVFPESYEYLIYCSHKLNEEAVVAMVYGLYVATPIGKPVWSNIKDDLIIPTNELEFEPEDELELLEGWVK